MGLGDHGAHVEAGAILGRLHVVEPPGKRAGPRMDMHVDQAVEHAGDGGLLLSHADPLVVHITKIMFTSRMDVKPSSGRITLESRNM
jgi:hypothetical protein